MKKLILVLVLSVFVVGLGAGSAMADSIMFPWVVKNTNVTTLLSVVQTSEISSTCRQSAQFQATLHYQYWHKPACHPSSPAGTCVNNLTGVCEEFDIYRPTSQNDIVSFDAGGLMNLGQPLFNDLPGREGIVNYGPNPDFSIKDVAVNPTRGFLLVDNNNTTCFEDANEASVYGEAMIFELSNGAGWGYVAYNGVGGGASGPNDEPTIGFGDGSDLQGEVMRSPRWFDVPNEGELEATPTVLLPLNKFKTKMFMTPINYAEASWDEPLLNDLIIGARTGSSNARVQLCTNPETVSDLGLGIADTCGAGDFLSEDSCQSNAAAMCQAGGIFDNDETRISSIVTVDVVCTGALDISATTTPLNGANTTLLNAGQISYLTTYGGAGWAYVRSMVGAYWPTDFSSVRNNLTRSDMMIGKLEYTEALITISGVEVGGEVNDFKWIRNSASLWDEDWDLDRGINAIMQAGGFGD